MDTETVIALGFVIHQLLGFIGGIVLCYFGYRLLMKRVKGRQRDWRWNWKSAKALIKNAAPAMLFALFGAGAIWLTAANGFAPRVLARRMDVPESPANLLPSETPPSATPSSATLPTRTPAGDHDHIVMTLRATRPEMSLADRGALSENYSIADQPPRPLLPPAPTVSSTPKPTPTAAASATSVSVPKELSASDRKALERERREVERKRSRLEDMYQKHLISSEAYKKGEEEYKSAILKYRSQINGAGAPEQ